MDRLNLTADEEANLDNEFEAYLTRVDARVAQGDTEDEAVKAELAA